MRRTDPILRITLTFVLACVVSLTMTTCQKTDTDAAYIVINKEDITVSYDELELSQFNSTSGLTAHEFTDIWVTVNGEKLGTWELPCRVPVLDEGYVEVRLNPGIALNGMSTTRPEYPFVQYDLQKVKLTKGQETTLVPKFKYYKTNLYFPLVENFESAGTSFASTDTSQHVYVQKIDDPDLIYRNPYDDADLNTYSGLVQLKDSIKSFEIASGQLKLPGAGKSVFLELNYKCDEDLYTGLVIIQSNTVPTHESLVVLRGTNGVWKKAYINLTLAVSRNTTASGFKVLLSGSKNNRDVANFYFDNIRVLYVY